MAATQHEDRAEDGLGRSGCTLVAGPAYEQAADDQQRRGHEEHETADDHTDPIGDRLADRAAGVGVDTETDDEAGGDAQHAPHVVAVAVEGLSPPCRPRTLGAIRALGSVRGATTRGTAARSSFRRGGTTLRFHSANNANSSPTSHRGPSTRNNPQCGGRFSGDRAVVPTRGLEAGRDHHHAQPSAALGADAWGVELSPAGPVALVGGPPAPATEGIGHRRAPQMTLLSTPIGMWRSSSICRSSSGERPSVVR